MSGSFNMVRRGGRIMIRVTLTTKFSSSRSTTGTSISNSTSTSLIRSSTSTAVRLYSCIIRRRLDLVVLAPVPVLNLVSVGFGRLHGLTAHAGRTCDEPVSCRPASWELKRRAGPKSSSSRCVSYQQTARTILQRTQTQTLSNKHTRRTRLSSHEVFLGG